MHPIFRSLGLCLALLTSAVHAEPYPTKPVRIVVTFSPGGATDTTMRALAVRLSEGLGQPVVIENKAGGGGIVGALEVMHSPADGYTLFSGSSGTHVVNPLIKKSLPYDAAKDFIPLSLVLQAPLFIAVNPKLKVKTLAELAALGKKRRVTFASPGNAHTLAIANLGETLGAQFEPIPYKGPGQAQTDVIAGHVDAYMDTGLAVLGQTKADKLTLLAITSAQRAPNFPNVSTVAESYPGYSATANVALFVRTGTPAEIVTRLRSELHKVIAQPTIQKLILDSAGLPVNGSAEDVEKWMRTETSVYQRIIEKTSLVFE